MVAPLRQWPHTYAPGPALDGPPSAVLQPLTPPQAPPLPPASCTPAKTEADAASAAAPAEVLNCYPIISREAHPASKKQPGPLNCCTFVQVVALMMLIV